LTGGAALNGPGRSVTSWSGVLFPSVEMVALVVLIIATEPPSHKLVYTLLPSSEEVENMRKRAEAGVQGAGKTGAQNAAGASANGFVGVPVDDVPGISNGKIVDLIVRAAASKMVTCGMIQLAADCSGSGHGIPAAGVV